VTYSAGSFPSLPGQVTLVHATVNPNLPTGAGYTAIRLTGGTQAPGHPGVTISVDPSTSSPFPTDKPDKSHVTR
jgi:hypothetical protein